GDAEAADLGRKVAGTLVSAEVTDLIAQGRFPDAVKKVRGRRAELADGGAALEARVRGEWLARAEAEATAGRPDDAAKLAARILETFPGDAAIEERRAGFANTARLIQTEQVKGLVAKALALQDEVRKLPRTDDRL